MTNFFLGVIIVFICLIVLFASGKKTPSHPLAELPAPSYAVQALITKKRLIDAIKLYRQETGASLHEAKQVIDSAHR